MRGRPGAALLVPAALLPVCAALSSSPSGAAVRRLTPKTVQLKTSMDPQMDAYLYAPPATEAEPGKAAAGRPTAVIFFSGEWGWKPLPQDACSHLAAQGRHVLGIDSTDYFKRLTSGPALAADLEAFRAFVNEQGGRAKDDPVLLVGYSFGAEMIPYILGRGGARGVRGALLVAPDRSGAAVYRVVIQLKMPSPPDETFDVGEEIRRMPPIPVAIMQGTLDTLAAGSVLLPLARGPRLFVPIEGGDRQFRQVRDPFFAQLAQALRWLENAPAAAAETAREPEPASGPAERPAPSPSPEPGVP
jgi:dienelactone hydrolase